MSSSTRQMEFLARALVNRLEDRGIVEFTDAEAGIAVVARVLSDTFREVEQVEQEARQRLGREIGSREPTADELESAMHRVAAEKGVTL
jgi:hypothetical protein